MTVMFKREKNLWIRAHRRREQYVPSEKFVEVMLANGSIQHILKKHARADSDADRRLERAIRDLRWLTENICHGCHGLRGRKHIRRCGALYAERALARAEA